jgi:DNA-binding GntR family transcriptional regulator
MRARASEAIAADLRRMIVTGELAPGAVLGEGELCELFDCSRTPLREALQQLCYNYLVTLPPRRGIHIPPLSIIDYQQAHEAMLVLYPALANLANERITEQQLREMRGLIADQEQANRDGQFYELADLDYRFHSLIARATENQYLLDSVSRLHGAVARWVYKSFETSRSASLSIAEHSEILEALGSRDAERVREGIGNHSISSSERVVNTLGLRRPLASSARAHNARDGDKR